MAAEHHRYVRSHAFEVGDVVATASGPDYAAVTDGERVELVDTDGHVAVELDAPASALAADRTRTYCLCESDVTAVSRGGAVTWRVDVADAQELTADPAGTFVVVATSEGELVGLDADVGTERFRVPQPHRDVAGAPNVTCLGDSVVLASWSFVTVLDDRGETVAETSIDGAAESVSSLGDDRILVSTKDGRLVCLDAEGEVAWEHRADVSWVAESGDEWVAAVLDDEDAIGAIEPDGTVEAVHDRSGSAHAVAADGSTVCVVRNGTLVAYRAAGAAADLSVAFGDDHLVPGEELTVTIRNEGDERAVATVAVDADGATVGTTAFDVTLDPGERSDRQVDVVAVESGRQSVDARVTLDGERAAETTFEVSELSGDPVTADAVVRDVSEGGASVEVMVRNDSHEPLTRVGIGSRGTATVPPGRTETFTVRRSLPVDRLSVVGQNVDVEASVESDLDEPVVSVRGRDDGWFDVRVVNETDTRFEDVLRVEVSGSVEADPFPAAGATRPVEIPPRGTFVLAYPAPGTSADERAFEVTASLDGVSASVDRRRVRVSGLAVDPLRRTGASEPSGARERTRAGPASEPALPAGSGEGDASAGNVPASVDVERSFGDTATAGTAFVERLTVENHSDRPVAPVVRFEATDETPSERVELDSLDPGAATRVTRRHAAWGRDELTLAGGVVTDGDERVESFGAASVPVDPNPLLIRLWAPVGASTLDVVVENTGDRPRIVTQIAVRGARNGETIDEVVDPGETVDRSVSMTDSIPDDAVRAAVEHAPADDPDATAYFETLVARRERPGRTVDLSAAVAPETDIADGYGEVVLRFTNEGDATLDAVTVEATGAAPDDYLYYGPESFESVEPGQSFTHRVDVDADADELRLPVDVTTETADETASESVVVESVDGSLAASGCRDDPALRPVVLVTTAREE